MKLNSNTFANWLKSAKEGVRFFLIYGYDLGQVKLLSDDLLSYLRNKLSEINLLHFTFDQLKANLPLLKEELSSRSLFGGAKIIVITGCGATISKDFSSILEQDNSGTIFIFQAEELRPSSSLRKSFEAMENGVAVACYKDDQASLEKYIRQFFLDQKTPVESNVPALLASLLPSDRLQVKGELEKLLLYKEDQDSAITTSDISHVIADAADLSFDDLCTAYALGDIKNVQVQLKRLLGQDANFMLIIRVLQKYLYRLFELLNHSESGLSMEAAVAKLSPPVFFKQKDNLLKVVRVATILDVKRSILALLTLESSCKSGILEPQVLLVNFLTRLNPALTKRPVVTTSPSNTYNDSGNYFR